MAKRHQYSQQDIREEFEATFDTLRKNRYGMRSSEFYETIRMLHVLNEGIGEPFEQLRNTTALGLLKFHYEIPDFHIY